MEITKKTDSANVPSSNLWNLKHFGIYAGKAIVVIGLLIAVAHFISLLPPVGVGIVWALLSLASATGIAYYAVMNKTHRQFLLKAGGSLSKINEGRMVRLIIAFVVSAVLMAGLVFSLPYWEWPEWLLLALTIPAYYGVLCMMSKVLARQYEPLFQTGSTVWWSGIVTGILLCAAYGAIYYFQPVPTCPSAEAALMAAVNPFEGSPSVLLSESGQYLAYAEALKIFAQEQAADLSFGFYLGWRILVAASALFGVTSLLEVCALTFPEIKRIFLPLESAKQPSQSYPIIKKYLVLFCLLPTCLVGAFVVADSQAEKVVATQEYSWAESFVRDQIGIAAFVLDGKYYDYEATQALMDDTSVQSEALYAEASAALEPVINEVIDKQLANIDPYLDWYYSLPADYERLLQYFTGTVEEGMKEQLESQINNGVDDSALTSQMESYMAQVNELHDNFKEQLAACELVNIPPWMITNQMELPETTLTEIFAPTQKLLDAGTRLGISAGTGIAGGLITKAVTQKIIAKPFFNKIVTRLAEALASRGLVEAAATGGGTLIAPGVGTAIGIVAGTALGFASDYIFLKVDEAANRESYRAEIVDALESQRSELLGLFKNEALVPQG